MRLNRRKIEGNFIYIIQHFEVFKSVEGFYCIHNTIINRTTYYSNYDIIRLKLTELIR